MMWLWGAAIALVVAVMLSNALRIGHTPGTNEDVGTIYLTWSPQSKSSGSAGVGGAGSIGQVTHED